MHTGGAVVPKDLVTSSTGDGTVLGHDQVIEGILTSIKYYRPIGTIGTLIATLSNERRSIRLALECHMMAFHRCNGRGIVHLCVLHVSHHGVSLFVRHSIVQSRGRGHEKLDSNGVAAMNKESVLLLHL